MGNFKDIQVIKEFKNDDRNYGVYSLIFKSEHHVFIRNNNSVGTVAFYYDEPASKCVSEIRADVKAEFFEELEKLHTT